MPTPDDLVAQYQENHSKYQRFNDKVQRLLAELLADQGVLTHSITSRCKDPKSLKAKIEKKEGKYSDLSRITDLVGLRVITLFPDDVDRVANIVESEFDIDIANTIDKRAAHDPDRFGYMSLHYVISLPLVRTRLPEYAAFSDCPIRGGWSG